MEENQTAETATRQLKFTRWQKWLLIACAAIVVIAIVVLIWAGTLPESYYNTDGTLTASTEADFVTIAEIALKDYLKAPSTLELDYSTCTWKAYENDVFALSGTFSAENAFGVPMASEFYVSFHYGGEYDNSDVMKVVIDNEVYFEREG